MSLEGPLPEKSTRPKKEKRVYYLVPSPVSSSHQNKMEILLSLNSHFQTRIMPSAQVSESFWPLPFLNPTKLCLVIFLTHFPLSAIHSLWSLPCVTPCPLSLGLSPRFHDLLLFTPPLIFIFEWPPACFLPQINPLHKSNPCLPTACGVKTRPLRRVGRSSSPHHPASPQ